MASVHILLTFIAVFNIQGVYYTNAATLQRKSNSLSSSSKNEKIFRSKRAVFDDYTLPDAIREDYEIGKAVVKIYNNNNNNVQGWSNEEFTIDPQSESKKFTLSNDGWLLLDEALDYESFPTEEVLVRIVETDGTTNYKSVIINVENVPEFDQGKYDGLIEEEKSNNPTEILKVALRASDPDRNNVNFALDAGGDALTESLFRVESDGSVVAVQQIDREIREVFTFEIRATNSEGIFGTTDVVVTVTDINDNGPKFGGFLFGSVEEENPAGTTFVLKEAPVDPDLNSNPANFQYTIQSSSADDSSNFEIAGTNDVGEAIIRTKSVLDREVKPTLSFTIEVRDSSGKFDAVEGVSLVIVTIEDINDNSPVFNTPIFISEVPEDTQLEASVGAVIATDPDDPSNFALKFEIISGNDGDIFSIETKEDTNEGMIMLKKPLDYDNSQTRKYTLKVRVTDPEEPNNQQDVDPEKQEAEADIYVTGVNDNVPTFTNIETYNTVISEDIAVNTILQPPVAAEDNDASDENDGNNFKFSYSIAPETDPDNDFTINSNGEISVKEALDREKASEYNLTILATDEGTPPNTGSALYFINVTDVNDNAPIITEEKSKLFVYEGRAPPEPVNPPLEPYDPDWSINGPPYTYEVVEPLSNFVLYLEGDNTETAYINATAILDRAQQSSYVMQVRITDSGENPQSQISTLTIEVLSEGPSAQIGVLSIGGIIAIIIAILILLLIVIAVAAYKCLHNNSVTKAVYVDDDIRENFIAYDEEGGGEEDQEAYDISLLSKPVDDTGGANRPLQPEKSRPLGSGPPMGDAPNIADFIGKGINEADDDPNAPPHDSMHTYEYEGGGSSAGSLSSLNSSSTDEDQNYDYLNDWGPRFQKLADMYGGGESD